ncbi:alkyl hydroperoxide reductase/ Thiol specific antioxidant/ Mal allergen [Mycolicibacterium smegmatis]|nr:alkyl hydroperoxide reductase/ Thiol specific antioxidant/ Mal allergen [Mycolicibacterium smegmatis]
MCMSLLHPGKKFPHLRVTPPAAPAIDLPDHFEDRFGVVLFFRGAWCPYCVAQLRAFDHATDKLRENLIDVVAMSVDHEATTAKLIAEHGLRFPVGHSADARTVAEQTGAFVNAEPLHLQSTGFVLDPAGRVTVSVYSSGAIGRLVPADVIGMVRYLREHSA